MVLVRALLRQYPFVLKNFRHYFHNLWRRQVRRTNIVAPYAAVLYVTHKCNLDCTYCTQKEPDVFSQELGTEDTIRLLKIIRRETDSILFTGGEPTLRDDIEELTRAARDDLNFRSVLLVTNGTLLHKRQKLFDSLHSLIISLDSLTVDSTQPMSKPSVLARVLDNLELAKSRMPRPTDITISTVIEEWNTAEIERILDFCGEQGFVFATQSALHEKMPNLRFASESTLSGAGRKDHRASPLAHAAHQRHAQADPYYARIRGFSVFSHHVPARLSERRRLLPLRTAQEGQRESPARGLVRQGLYARAQALWRHSRVQSRLPPLRERDVFILREGFLGTGGRHDPVGARRRLATVPDHYPTIFHPLPAGEGVPTCRDG